MDSATSAVRSRAISAAPIRACDSSDLRQRIQRRCGSRSARRRGDLAREPQAIPDQAAAGLQVLAVEPPEHRDADQLHVAGDRQVGRHERPRQSTGRRHRRGADEGRARAIQVAADLGAPQADIAQAGEAQVQQHVAGDLDIGQPQRLARARFGQFSSDAPQHSTLLSIVAPSRLTPPCATKPWRSRTAPPITAFSAASATPVPSAVALVRAGAVALQVAADPGADQADRALRGEAVAQQHRAADHGVIRRPARCRRRPAVGLVRLAPSHSRLLPMRAPRRLMAPSAAKPLRSRTEPPISAVSAASTTPLAILAAVHQPGGVHVEGAGDARAHQPDHARGDEAVTQDDHAVEPRRLCADRIPFAGADPRAARDHVAGHMRRVQRHTADCGEPAHQVEAAADLRAGQTQRIAGIAMRDAGARRRDLQPRTTPQKIAVNHRGMRIDPGDVRQSGSRRRYRASRRSARPGRGPRRYGCRAAKAAPVARWSGRPSQRCRSFQRQRRQAGAAWPGTVGEVERSSMRAPRMRTPGRRIGHGSCGRQTEQQVAQERRAQHRRSASPENAGDLTRAVRVRTSASASSRIVGSNVRPICSSGMAARR